MPNPDGCVERAKEVPPDASHSRLSCRVCAHRASARGDRQLQPLLRASRSRSTTGTVLRRTVTRERIAAGPPSIWRYADLLPVDAPDEPRLAPGFTPLVPAPRLAEELGIAELWLKLDTANPTHSFKDRVVAVAARKAQELGFETLSCSSTGNLAGAVAARAAAEGLEAAVFVPADLEPEKLTAAAAYGPTVYAVDGHYDHCSRLSVELSFELPWGFVNVNLRSYYAEGSKTLAYEIAEQLGWRAPDVVVGADRLGRALPQGRPGLRRAPRARARRRRRADARRRPGRRAAQPVATAFRERTAVEPVRPDTIARSLAIGSPADGDFAVATARETGGSIHAVAEEAVGENMALLARDDGRLRRDGDRRHARRAPRRHRGRRGRSRDRVVLLVTGDGLKTPGACRAHVRRRSRSQPDADAFLDDVLAVA